MPAYLIVSARITDPQAFRAYAVRAAELVAQFGGRYLVLGGAAQTLEGEPVEAGAKWVISEWPDVASARRFWDSAEYAEAKRLREGTGHFDVRLIEGPSPVPVSPERSS
jgi:uncharacterized protein (DUF1330 family)